MIVVDSSARIELLRGHGTAVASKLKAFVQQQDDQLLVGDIILLELLQGARDDRQAAGLERDLRRYQVISMLDPDLAVRAASNYRILRQKGVTIRKTADLIIGTYCLERGHQLLHNDRDFDPMVTHLGLQAA